MNRRLFTLALPLAILGILMVYFLYAPTDPLDRKTIQDIFGKNATVCLTERHDIGGIDIHGDIFFFFAYDVEYHNNDFNSIKASLGSYPKFKSGYFKNEQTVDSPFIGKWRQCPIRGRSDSLVFRGTLNLVPHEYFNKQYLSDPDNLYCFVLGNEVGNVFMILIPKKKKMYLVVHDIG